MNLHFKYSHLVFIMMMFLCISCIESLYLTEVSGNVNNTEDCKGNFLYIYENLEEGRAVDSLSISADGSYYVAFSGARLLEMRGSAFCGSDYHIIERGYKQTKDFSFKPLRSGIELNVNPDRINADLNKLNISLERMLEGHNNSLITLPNDFHNVKTQLKKPLDTLLNLTLVDQQFYRLHISGLDSLNSTILSISDTIKVDANLSEIVF